MLILMVERKKLYIIAGILACLCAVFLLMCGIVGRKMSVGAFLTESSGQETEQVEIFYIEKGSVVSCYENNAGFRKEAIKYLDSISGMYGNVKVFPKAGYIVKIPLEPPTMLSAKLPTDAGIEYVDKIYVIFPSQGKPYLLLLDGQSRPYCFNFEAETAVLQRYIVGSSLRYYRQWSGSCRQTMQF